MNRAIKKEEELFFESTTKTESRKEVSKFYEVVKSSRGYYEKFLLSNCCKKRVLEYGCGTGSYAFFLARHGAKVVGIDITEVRINMAKAQAEKEGFEDIIFSVMDAEATQFEDSSFDMVCGKAILHHLKLDKALKELTRVLKPEGKAIFIEPMAHNPAISIYRKLTPNFRTKDEHPLTIKDLKSLQGYFHQVNYRFFYLFSLLAVPFRNCKWFPSLLERLDNLDRKLFEWLPFLRPLAWQVVIILDKPKVVDFK